MNKSSILLCAMLAISSAAFAAEPATTPQGNDTSSATAKRGLRDVGESFKDMGRRARNVAANPRGSRQPVAEQNTTGYAGQQATDFSGDSARRQRMDAAYANWQTRR
ncbi:MAG: hypothetical protein V4757_02390 [Pseudomonadota bacterium]